MKTAADVIVSLAIVAATVVCAFEIVTATPSETRATVARLERNHRAKTALDAANEMLAAFEAERVAAADRKAKAKGWWPKW